jgi:hypothetical protein
MTTLKELTPDPTNRRRHTSRNVEMITEAIETVGTGRSIVIDEDDVVLAGNATVKAAGVAGLTKLTVVEAAGDEVIAVRRRGLSSEQKRALALYDNRTAELAEWDVEQLVEDVDAGLDLGAFFEPVELDELLPPPDVEGLTDPDTVPEPRATDIKRGDLFTLGDHRLLCGDSTHADDVARVMDGAKADLMFTDPPYGVNVSGKGGKPIAGDISFTAIPLMFDVLDGVLGEGAWCYICGGQSNMLLYSRMFERYFRQLPRVIVWDKGKTAVMRRNGYHSCYELIYYAFRTGGGGRWLSERTSDHADDIWRYTVEVGENRHHVTQKPVELAERAIRNSCPSDGVMFEPFTGSGSTLLAAEQLGRKCCAIEIEPSYCQVTIDRWEAFTGKTASKVT